MHVVTTSRDLTSKIRSAAKAGFLTCLAASWCCAASTTLWATPEIENIPIEANNLKELRIENPLGDVSIKRVVEGSGQSAAIVVEKKSFPQGCSLHHESSSGILSVRVKAGFFARCEVDLSLRVPEKLDVTAKVGDGDLEITGVEGRMKIVSGNGDISVLGTIEELELTSANGDVSVTGLVGTRSIVKTGNGDIELAWSKIPDSGSVEVKSGNGDTVLRIPAGSRIKTRYKTGYGSFKNELGDSPGARFEVSGTSGAGDVELRSTRL